MRNLVLILGLTVALAACSKTEAIDLPAGSDVTVQKRDGVAVTGRLVEVKAEQVILESRDGTKLEVPRSQITAVRASAAPSAAPNASPEAAASPTATSGSAPNDATPPADAQSRGAAAKPVEHKTEYREVTVPTGTVLPVTLKTRVDSDRSHAEDPVHGTLRRAVVVEGVEALPAGTAVLGHVTTAREAGKVKGRAMVAVRFNEIDLPGAGGRESITTASVSRLAPATKKKDATRIGVGAGAGAVLGGILGGKGGAAKGAAIGGGAGTAVVLATRGNEVGMAAGAPLSIKLTAPLTVRVPVK